MLTPTLILPTQAVEPEGFFATIDTAVNDVFGPFNTFMADVVFWSPSFFPMPWIVMWLLAAAIIITVYLGFIQVRGIKTASEVIRGKFSSPDDPGEIPHYQALTSAVSGTVGLGNIAGVGAAMVIGGPGATFWMILAGIFGMATKFAECTLGVKYRTVYEDGSVSGGPFKYLPVAFNKFPKFISVGLTGLFAVSILFFGVAGGNMFQANQTYSQAVEVTGGPEDSFLANS
ncbi:MAG: alanine:cation symporter family protein, partial [Ornithinimicrobium sp.]